MSRATVSVIIFTLLSCLLCHVSCTEHSVFNLLCDIQTNKDDDDDDDGMSSSAKQAEIITAVSDDSIIDSELSGIVQQVVRMRRLRRLAGCGMCPFTGRLRGL